MKIFTDHPFRAAPDAPLYQQLYAHLQTAILAGRLPAGMKLPSTRALADELLVSRNTILNAYEQLTAEGYIESVEGSGTFVADVLPEQLLTTPEPRVHAAPRPCSPEMHQPILSRRARAQLTSPQIVPLLPPAADGRPRPFRLGMSALDAFPYQLWSRLVARHARRMSIGAITYQDPAGYKPLREAIAAHLTVSRRVRCTPEQIVITPPTPSALAYAKGYILTRRQLLWYLDHYVTDAEAGFLGCKRDSCEKEKANEKRDHIQVHNHGATRGLSRESTLLHARHRQRRRQGHLPNRLAHLEQLSRWHGAWRGVCGDARVTGLSGVSSVSQGTRSQLYPALALGAVQITGRWRQLSPVHDASAVAAQRTGKRQRWQAQV
jgi:DNA-binding transcriptional regulator YhcF (GntR family)